MKEGLKNLILTGISRKREIGNIRKSQTESSCLNGWLSVNGSLSKGKKTSKNYTTEEVVGSHNYLCSEGT